MLRAIGVLLGATAFQLATAAVEMRPSEIGDVMRLLVFACAFAYFISVLPGARADSRRSSRNLDERFSGFDRRAVRLTLRGPGKPSRANPVPAE
jgi:hypothetical protein